MKQPLQIHFLGMEPSGAVEAAVRHIEDMIRKRRDQERQAPGELQDEVPAEFEKAQHMSQGKTHVV